ncbi:hypothetical protein OIT41_20420 (plasmid) [Arthrobacter sp. YA7-1]|uniref:hypothetical protein n=1 Tax=Arthrobacter sp. YA7-1 TaxID=2987701 RepID=UPI0022263A5E|nr:hypothetical protein [Arthrobacter sp. YA7-1]UYY83714.1 hypothetical protein OIT41_20420 [Arthrobacter sp. YA7-1]
MKTETEAIILRVDIMEPLPRDQSAPSSDRIVVPDRVAELFRGSQDALRPFREKHPRHTAMKLILAHRKTGCVPPG